jgi:multidrug efflux pump subunit AcrA (membrane-fusion protein)
VSEIPVRIKLDQIDARVIPDLTASAEILLGTEKDVLLAPRAAVFGEDGGWFVFVEQPEGWLRKNIQVGRASNLSVEIRSGLEKGDKVALQRPI